MDVFQTKVFAKIDRQVASRVLTQDASNGRSLLLYVVDSLTSKISASERLVRNLQDQVAAGVYRLERKKLPSVSNFDETCRSLQAESVDKVVRGLGRSLPCFFGWIGAVNDRTKMINWRSDTNGVDQNCFLPVAGNFISSSCSGFLGLSVEKYSSDEALERIKLSDPNSPFEAPSWNYLYLLPSDSEDKAIKAALSRKAAQLKTLTSKHVKSVRAKKHNTSVTLARIPIGQICSSYFKKAGFAKNNTQPRGITVLDKPTPNGNLIRLEIDTGGIERTIPYVQIRFVSPIFRSVPVSLISHCDVTAKAELLQILKCHEEDLNFFESSIAAKYDQIVGPPADSVRELIQKHPVREVI